MNKNKKIVITGIGIVSAAGIGVKKLLKVLLHGESTSTSIESIDVSPYPVRWASQVKDFKIGDFFNSRDVKHMERCSQLGVVAAKLAVEDAGLNIKKLNQDRLEIYEGTSIGGMDRIFSDHEILLSKGYQKLHPFTPIRAFVGSTTGEISIALGINSRSITVCSGSASANDAIGIGFERIKSGMIDMAIVGGAEAPIIPAIIASFCKMGVVSTRNGNPKTAFRPFSRDRDGFILGEGAAFLIIESERSAIRRKAKIYAELAGYGSSCDAYHMVIPHAEGAGIKLATQRALKSARLTINDVDYINAHGTGTILNDKFETLAFKNTFGNRAYDIAISSTKPITGHLLGACGAIEAAICILAIENAFVPPTINIFEPDPECNLNFTPNAGLEKKINTALSYTYGFGGKNSVLIFKKITE